MKEALGAGGRQPEGLAGEAADPVVQGHSASGAGRVSVIVPIYNALWCLERVLDSIERARERFPDTELVLVDHGSEDGSWELVNERCADRDTVLRTTRGNIAHVRNLGAAHASGEFLSFLDSDCLIGPGYFSEAVQVLERTGAGATGSRVAVPDDPHWIEDAWNATLERRGDEFTHFMNSGNFFIRADAFRAVGGFDERLVTGEDDEISRRLILAGWRIYEAQRVRAVHLGNAKSLGAFFRKEMWRGIGQFAIAQKATVDKPLVMTLVHLGLTALALASGAASGVGPATWLLGVLGSQLLVPVCTVAYRSLVNHRFHRPLAAVFLYWVFYWARAAAMAGIAGDLVRRRFARARRSRRPGDA